MATAKAIAESFVEIWAPDAFDLVKSSLVCSLRRHILIMGASDWKHICLFTFVTEMSTKQRCIIKTRSTIGWNNTDERLVN